ncbi:Chromosome transmission fidelity protein 18 [Cyberlindnera fabianii]|uniref:Chromosome transmission fidelity protein 18 n=1 Tax=Cyberlindnera fabianii TaxID=36022 RepID=A0A1V2L850_CYBFA|nr:Chromosome transmission fidelity protein 18 [Cyberlindnera fabianii]
MSKPILDFSLDSLKFQNTILATSKSGEPPSGPPTVPKLTSKPTLEIHNDNEKPVHLADGRKINIKKRSRATQKAQKAMKEIIQEQKENYGFNINELLGRLEVQKLKEQSQLDSTSSSGSYLKDVKSETLWAEKWRPQNFLDFVGNEAGNRKILRWVKKWDRVVFDKNFKPLTTADGKEESRFMDPFGRPERKVLLINGPPGLGKTTVSHVIAKQAGYEVMEINASDERAGQRVRDKIKNSLTTSTFSGKPVCLIADEVDGGAEFGFIKVLMDILKDDANTVRRFQHSESSKFFAQKGKNRPKFLLRPIICICNDPYVPALEKLRSQAEIVTFQQATEKALCDRLKHVCQAEKLRLTTAQLKEIILLTDFDIRSCLNLLQFGGGLNTSSDSRKKDFQMTWYGVVNEIFKRKAKLQKPAQFQELSQILNVNTTLDKIIQGCFQAYPDVHYQDIRMSKPALISDWLYFADIMSKTQFETNGDLSYYQGQVALQFFNQFSDLSNRQSIKIKSDWEWFEKQKMNNNVVNTIFNRLQPNLRTILSVRHLSSEVLPFVNTIITPERKNAFQVKDSDIVKIHNSIDVVRGFGLYLSRSKDDGYNEIYVTQPDFSTVTRFDPQTVKKQQMKQAVVFPLMLKEMATLKAKKRAFEEMTDDGATQVNNIETLKDQYKKINEIDGAEKKQKVNTKAWVKYHEGFSNAVRKPVKWGMLFE